MCLALVSFTYEKGKLRLMSGTQVTPALGFEPSFVESIPKNINNVCPQSALL